MLEEDVQAAEKHRALQHHHQQRPCDDPIEDGPDRCHQRRMPVAELERTRFEELIDRIRARVAREAVDEEPDVADEENRTWTQAAHPGNPRACMMTPALHRRGTIYQRD